MITDDELSLENEKDWWGQEVVRLLKERRRVRLETAEKESKEHLKAEEQFKAIQDKVIELRKPLSERNDSSAVNNSSNDEKETSGSNVDQSVGDDMGLRQRQKPVEKDDSIPPAFLPSSVRIRVLTSTWAHGQFDSSFNIGMRANFRYFLHPVRFLVEKVETA